MKRNIFIVFCVCFFLNIKAQINFYITAGINYSNVDLVLFPPFIKDQLQHLYKYKYLSNFGICIEKHYKDVVFGTGVMISNRGSKNYAFPNPFHEYTNDIYTFLEIPLLSGYKINNINLVCGGGINLNKRIGSNILTNGDYNKPYGADLVGYLQYSPLSWIKIVPKYTFGNFDKRIFYVEDNHIHHVFSLNLYIKVFSLMAKTQD